MQHSKACILFAEDDDNDVLLMKRALDRAGVRMGVVVVEDSQKAIEFLARSDEDPDAGFTPGQVKLLLLDLKLLGSTGYEVLEFLKEQPHLKRFPIVVLSSSCSNDGRARAVKLGADEFIIKPNGFDDLTEVCRKLHRMIQAFPAAEARHGSASPCRKDA